MSVGDHIDDRRERARGIGRLRRMRIDIDRCSNDDSTEVELTQPHSRYDDRGTERLAHQGPAEKLTN